MGLLIKRSSNLHLLSAVCGKPTYLDALTLDQNILYNNNNQ